MFTHIGKKLETINEQSKSSGKGGKKIQGKVLIGSNEFRLDTDILVGTHATAGHVTKYRLPGKPRRYRISAEII